MAEYIDKEKLLQKLSRMIDYCKNDNKVNGLTALFQVGDAIMDCPTVEVEEKKGSDEKMRMSKIVELPCGIGDSIFYIHRSSQGNNYILKADVLGVVVVIYGDIKKIYLKIIYEDIDGYTDRATATYGVNAFSMSSID